MSKAIAVIGGTGTGKTTWNKGRILNVNPKALMIYDVNNEYNDILPQNDIPKIEDFLTLARNTKDSVILFEEATIFFSTHSNDESMRDLLVRKRHTNNLIILVFHSLQRMPKYIYELLNYIVLFKTNDNSKDIDQKFKAPELVACFNRVKSHKNPHYYEVLDPGGNIMHT